VNSQVIGVMRQICVTTTSRDHFESQRHDYKCPTSASTSPLRVVENTQSVQFTSDVPFLRNTTSIAMWDVAPVKCLICTVYGCPGVLWVCRLPSPCST
jgi:hypothetical protein